jgi:DNA-directed RNA polymerase specialized sigma24 family protein
MNKLYIKQNTKSQLIFLNKGIEKGLNFFYQKFYPYFFLRSNRATQDSCIATNIAHEGFLRLWLFRENIHTEEDIFNFLKTQTSSGIQAFYGKTRNRFNRSLLQLDAIENCHEFLAGYEEDEDVEDNVVYLDQLEDEKKEQLNKLNNLLPSLNLEQQLLIKLCLQYSFNYERIAYYLGGISDYEVSLKVEKTIDILRSILTCTEKMNQLTKTSKIVAQGNLTDEQSEIFRLRYELHLSFEEISQQLQLKPSTVKKLFVEAHSKIKPSKQIA